MEVTRNTATTETLARVQQSAMRSVQEANVQRMRAVGSNEGQQKTDASDGTQDADRKRTLVPEQLQEVVENLNKTADVFNKRLKFELDDETDRLVVKVVDRETQEVIRQIPPEEALEVAKKIERLIGLFVDETA